MASLRNSNDTDSLISLESKSETNSQRNASPLSSGDIVIEEALPQRKNSPTSEDYDTDLDDGDAGEEEKEIVNRENVDIGHHSYDDACKLLQIPKINKIYKQLKEKEICLQHVGLDTNDIIALTYALTHNSRVESIDLEDNRITDDGLLHIVHMLRYNISISSLNLAENPIGPDCSLALADVVQESTWLTHLNLSGTHLGDIGAKHIAVGIRGNVSLAWLNLSHNEIGEMGAKHIGKAITINDTLQVLDLSWNHIRRIGAVTICSGLQENSSIVSLNLSWNGFAFEGSIALEEVLKKNMTLKVLDISNNRINWEGVIYIARGLKLNNVMQILKIGCNPISTEACHWLLDSVNNEQSNMAHISLEDIPINTKVQNLSESIAEKRQFSIAHGGLKDSHGIKGTRKEKKEDPLSLLAKYIGLMGFRVVDLFRMFNSNTAGTVTKENFVKGLKKIGAPINEHEMRLVAQRLDRKGAGLISYSLLANGLRNKKMEERKEDQRLEMIERRKREKRKHLLNQGVSERKRAEITDISVLSASTIKAYSHLMSSTSTSTLSSLHGPLSARETFVLPAIPKINSNKLSMTSHSFVHSLPAISPVSTRQRQRKRKSNIESVSW